MARGQGTKLLVSAVKPVLIGTGFIAGKSGRTWYEDNGWFLSLIDFQAPTNWQGSFLNVAAMFLWTPRPDGQVATYFDYGGRIGHNTSNDGTTIEYSGDDESYASQCESLARRALKEAEKLRLLCDWEMAKHTLMPHVFCSDELWGNWNRAMLCFITGDSRAARYLKAFSSFDKLNNDSIRSFVAEQSLLFGPLVEDFPAAQARIGEVIMTNRQILQKQMFSTIDLNWCFQAPPIGSIPELPIIPERAERQGIWGLFKRKTR